MYVHSVASKYVHTYIHNTGMCGQRAYTKKKYAHKRTTTYLASPAVLSYPIMAHRIVLWAYRSVASHHGAGGPGNIFLTGHISAQGWQTSF